MRHNREREIIELLARMEGGNAQEIAEEIGISRSCFRSYMVKMRDKGVVEGTGRCGRNMATYRLTDEYAKRYKAERRKAKCKTARHYALIAGAVLAAALIMALIVR